MSKLLHVIENPHEHSPKWIEIWDDAYVKCSLRNTVVYRRICAHIDYSVTPLEKADV